MDSEDNQQSALSIRSSPDQLLGRPCIDNVRGDTNARTLFKALKLSDWKICQHVSSNAGATMKLHRGMNARSHGLFGSEDVWPTQGEVQKGSCLCCDMDYVLTVSNLRACPIGEPYIEIETWHRLGTCRISDCHIWSRAIQSESVLKGAGMSRTSPSGSFQRN
jgi:hypothetical protein